MKKVTRNKEPKGSEKKLESNCSDLVRRLETIIEGAGIGCWDLWVKTNTILLDSRCRQILGSPAERSSMTLMDWTSRIHGLDKAFVERIISEADGNSTSPLEHSYRMHRDDGSWVWLLERLTVSQDSNGQVEKITGFVTDVTRFKESESMSESIQSMARIGGWEYDMETGVTTWTTETYNIHGIAPRPDANINDSIKYYTPSEQPRILSYLENCFKGAAFRDNFEFCDASGQKKWVQAMGKPVRNSKGEIKRIRGTFQDVTAAHSLTLALENIVTSIDDIIFEFDAEHRYTNIWIRDESLLFAPREVLIGSYYKDTLPPFLGSILEDALSRVEASNQPFTFLYPGPDQKPDNEKVWFRGKLSKQRSTTRNAYTLVVSECTKEVILKNEEQKARAQLETFFSLAFEMLCIASTNGRFKKLNPMWTAVLGYSEQELLSRPFIDFVHPDDVQKTLHEIEKLSQGVPTLAFENRYRTKDGSYKILSWVTNPDPISGDLYASARDITESRLKNQELSQVMKALDQSAIVAITDHRGVIKSVNQNFVDVSGYSKDELVGKKHSVIASGEHSPSFYLSLWRTISSGKIWSGEITNRSKSGQQYILQSVISPMLNLEGKIDSYLAIRFDITKKKESERLLIEAQRVAKIGSWSFDTQTKAIRWSDQMFTIFSEDKMRGEPSFTEHLSSIHPEDQEHWSNTVRKCLENGEPYRMRFRIVGNKGDNIWIEAYGEPIKDRQGNVTFLRGTCQDVSDLVMAEESLRLERAKAMHSAKLASLGEMSAGIAHEINNPLAIISGVVQNVSRYLDNPEKLKSKMEIIERATKRISKIVSGLRKFSRTSPKNNLKLHSLKGIAEEALVLTGSKSKMNSVEIEIECKEDVFLMCDELELEQVFVNLINNSLDAIKDSTRPWVKIRIFQDDTSAVVRIEDSGLGIPREVQDKMFQPFFTTKNVGEGTGLGLSIAKGIIEEHQGKIAILENRQNTCFEIRFLKSKEVKYAA